MVVDYAKCLSSQHEDVWTSKQAVCYLFDIDPIEFELMLFQAMGTDDEVKKQMLNEKWMLINEKISMLELEHEGKKTFRRMDFINWAIGKQFDVPDQLWKFLVVPTKLESTKIIPAETIENEPKQSSKVAAVFSEFENLRANEIDVIMMENRTAIMHIKGKKSITVHPDDLGLKAGFQGWELLEKASLNYGDLTQALRSNNKTTDRQKEKGKIVKIVFDLNKSLKGSMGLKDKPIIYEKNSGYRFIFKSMKNALLNGNSISKGDDAMAHIDNNEFDEDEYSRWNDDDD